MKLQTTLSYTNPYNEGSFWNTVRTNLMIRPVVAKSKRREVTMLPAIRGCVRLFLLLSFASASPAQEPDFAVRTAEGKEVRGQVRHIGEGLDLRIKAEELTEVEGDNLIALQQIDIKLSPFPLGTHIVLTTQDRIPVGKPRLIGEKLFIQHPFLAGGRDAQVPLGMLTMIWWRTPDGEVDPEKLRRRLETEPRKNDLVLLTNGDRFQGTLIRLDGDSLIIQVDRKPITLEVNRIAALVLSSELAVKPSVKGPYARAALENPGRPDSTRLGLTGLSCDDGMTLVGNTLFGVEVRAPLRHLVALDVHQGKAEYLSDLKPVEYESSPYLDLLWPLGVDASASGHDLAVGNSTFEKGLSLHAPARVSYQLDGKYRRFEALAGLDSRAGRLGKARIRAWADDKPLPLKNDGFLQAGGSVPVHVDVRGVRRLTLGVEAADRGNVQALVNWVNAMLVR